MYNMNLENNLSNHFFENYASFRNGNKKYTGLSITNKDLFARFDYNDQSSIQNAYISVQIGDINMVWEIQDHKIVNAPASLALWFKNYKKMALCTANAPEDKVFFFWNDKEFETPDSFTIWGVVENEDYGFAFYVDDSLDQILWLLESKTDTVSIIVRLLDCITEHVKKEALKDGIGTNDDFSLEADPNQWF